MIHRIKLSALFVIFAHQTKSHAMRLTSNQVALITDIIRDISPQETQIRLFGSCLNDHAKGGDVDLLLQTPQALTLMQRAQIKNALETQLNLPIDLITIGNDDILTPFAKIALETSELL
jgi:predicted nucleotidyltransferase